MMKNETNQQNQENEIIESLIGSINSGVEKELITPIDLQKLQLLYPEQILLTPLGIALVEPKPLFGPINESVPEPEVVEPEPEVVEPTTTPSTTNPISIPKKPEAEAPHPIFRRIHGEVMNPNTLRVLESIIKGMSAEEAAHHYFLAYPYPVAMEIYNRAVREIEMVVPGKGYLIDYKIDGNTKRPQLTERTVKDVPPILPPGTHSEAKKIDLPTIGSILKVKLQARDTEIDRMQLVSLKIGDERKPRTKLTRGMVALLECYFNSTTLLTLSALKRLYLSSGQTDFEEVFNALNNRIATPWGFVVYPDNNDTKLPGKIKLQEYRLGELVPKIFQDEKVKHSERARYITDQGPSRAHERYLERQRQNAKNPIDE